MVMAGKKPGGGTPEQRGFKLSLRSTEPVPQTRFVNLLVPLGPDEMMPAAELVKNDGDQLALRIRWPDGKVESVGLDLGWKTGGENGPADIALK